ncbi:hypothetical protein UFOVP112_109 [uncultured Caudovirales phage]|uniref:Uncharacterized protein n=1 Tax=uncultured Caudovirales phage TaxID=2100421 RepID=A0A6J5L6P3_9CAUD|nr:hypothetical protein UFOVP112_109 [uncultured Caudovirales phage]
MNQEEIDAYWAEVKLVVKPQIEYRIHYNEDGDIIMCSMADHPESMKYVVVDKTTYDNYFHYRIVNGQAVKIDNDAGYRVQLRKSKSGYPTVAGHASLVVESTETYNNLEYYERNN